MLGPFLPATRRIVLIGITYISNSEWNEQWNEHLLNNNFGDAVYLTLGFQVIFQ